MAANISLMPHVLELSGTPYERGRIHGETCRGLIHEFVESVIQVHQANNSLLKAEHSQLTGYCLRNVGFLQKWCPELVEEMQGIADGAGLPFADILYLNAFLELEDLRAPGLGGKALPDALWGCTTYNVTAAAAAGGQALLGQTYDMERYYEKFVVLLRIQPDSDAAPGATPAPAQLVVTFAGILGLNGVNSAGVAAVINKVVATDARPGVLYPCIMRRALAARRIGDALGAVVFSPRATGMNYQLAGMGVAFCAEVSASAYELLEIDGSIAHTNHYLSQHMRRFETANWLSHGGSMVRRQVAQDFLNRHRGALTPDLLKELSRNHVNHPRCICAHGFEGEADITAFHTVFAVVMDPAAGWLDLCVGNPCQGEYQRYQL
ncbi:C45 family autoproteolytic acyltransferase/hydolase [Megalodesulfovibrio paquesii]